jgi:hypothetical protein
MKMRDTFGGKEKVPPGIKELPSDELIAEIALHILSRRGGLTTAGTLFHR